MFDGRMRSQVDAGLRPVGLRLKKLGVTADVLTMSGLLFSVGAAAAIVSGWWQLAFVLVICTGVPDLLDGAVAKATGTAGPRGAFFDSVLDRVTDGLLFGAVAWNFALADRGSLVVLPVAVLASASWVSYIRAKADALGFEARGGVVERAERFILFLLGLLWVPLLVPVLWVLLALNLVTAGQRFVAVWKQASVGRPARRDPVARRRRARRVSQDPVGRRASAAERRARRQATRVR